VNQGSRWKTSGVFLESLFLLAGETDRDGCVRGCRRGENPHARMADIERVYEKDRCTAVAKDIGKDSENGGKTGGRIVVGRGIVGGDASAGGGRRGHDDGDDQN